MAILPKIRSIIWRNPSHSIPHDLQLFTNGHVYLLGHMQHPNLFPMMTGSDLCISVPYGFLLSFLFVQKSTKNKQTKPRKIYFVGTWTSMI